MNQLKEKGIDAIPFGNPAGKKKNNNIVQLDKKEEGKPSLVYMIPKSFCSYAQFHRAQGQDKNGSTTRGA